MFQNFVNKDYDVYDYEKKWLIHWKNIHKKLYFFDKTFACEIYINK